MVVLADSASAVVVAAGDAVLGSNPVAVPIPVVAHHGAMGHWAGRAVDMATARPAVSAGGEEHQAVVVGAWVHPDRGAAEALQRDGEAHTVQIAPRCEQVTGANPPRTNVRTLHGRTESE